MEMEKEMQFVQLMSVQDLLNAANINEYLLGFYLMGAGSVPVYKKIANEQALRLFQHMGVIPDRQVRIQCPTEGCGLLLSASSDRNRKLGYRFRCANKHCHTPTNNTLLERFRMNDADMGAHILLKLIHAWVRGEQLQLAQELASVNPETACSWYGIFRDVAYAIAVHDTAVIGGAGDIVEVGIRRLFKVKCDTPTGETWKDVWLLGGISRSTKCAFGAVVTDRSEDALIEQMQRHIDGCSFIVSNIMCRGAFAGHSITHYDEDPTWVPKGSFSQACLVQNWSGPVPSAEVEPVRYHTRNIEHALRAMKDDLKSSGKIEKASLYAGEWMYRNNILKQYKNTGGRFKRFLRDIARALPGLGKNPMNLDIDVCQCAECSTS